MVELRYIKPEELHSFYPTIRPGLVIVRQRIQADWLPEDVYMALKLGTSHLHVAFDNGQYVGFVVLTPERLNYSGRLNLHVWVAYNQGAPNVVDECFHMIENMAENGQFPTVTFNTPRRGWERRAKRLGFEVQDITLVKRME